MTREPALKILMESFADLISNVKLMACLESKLDYFRNKLSILIKNYKKVLVLRNLLPADVLKEIS